MRKSLAEIVVEEGLLDESRVAAAERYARKSGEPLVVTLVELERVPEVAIVAALGRRLRVPVIELAAETVEPDALREVPHELARRRHLVPLSLEVSGKARVLKIAMADPTDRDAIAEVEISTGCQVEASLATLAAVDEAIGREYRGFVTAIMHRDRGDETSPGPRRVPFGADLAVATPAMPGFTSESPTTQPFHSLEDEAPIELRHRALLELLHAKGLLSLEEYHAEIRRLLRERE